MEKDIQSILLGLRHIAAQIEKLSNLSDWQSQSKDVSELHTALSQAQGALPPLLVDSSGHTAKYASLPGIIEHIKPRLTEFGLSITQDITKIDGDIYLITTLRHDSGQWTRGKAPIFLPTREEMRVVTREGKEYTKDYNQECGKAISYMRRYALESMMLLKGDFSDYDQR